MFCKAIQRFSYIFPHAFCPSILISDQAVVLILLAAGSKIHRSKKHRKKTSKFSLRKNGSKLTEHSGVPSSLQLYVPACVRACGARVLVFIYIGTISAKKSG